MEYNTWKLYNKMKIEQKGKASPGNVEPHPERTHLGSWDGHTSSVGDGTRIATRPGPFLVAIPTGDTANRPEAPVALTVYCGIWKGAGRWSQPCPKNPHSPHPAACRPYTCSIPTVRRGQSASQRRKVMAPVLISRISFMMQGLSLRF